MRLLLANFKTLCLVILLTVLLLWEDWNSNFIRSKNELKIIHVILEHEGEVHGPTESASCFKEGRELYGIFNKSRKLRFKELNRI